MHRVIAAFLAIATALVIVTIAVAPFLTPQWVAFEQGRAQAAEWTGFSATDLRAATDSILADLVIGPPDFDVAVAGTAVLDERERQHMRDVRTVFLALWLAGAVAAVGLVAFALGNRAARDAGSPNAGQVAAMGWRAVRRGAVVLAVAVVALGAVALVAFDTLFEVFHRIFFPAGSYDFDPRTERLVQLFPFTFWQETAIVVGIVIVVLAALVAFMAGRRAARAAAPSRDPLVAAGPSVIRS